MSYSKKSYKRFQNRIKHLLLALILVIGCLKQEVHAQKQAVPPALFTENLFYTTEVMVTDVASPPAAARFYAYTTLAAHLAYTQASKSSLDESLLLLTNRQLEPMILDNSEIMPEFVSTYAMLLVGQQIMPSGDLLLEKQHKLISIFLKRKWLGKKEIEKNIQFASTIANQVLRLARTDGYRQLSTLTRYSPKKGEGYWFPTPPAYMAAVEPEWRTIQPFFLTNIQQYKPSPPAPFDLTEGSPFKVQLDEVFEVTRTLTEEQELIANFWDCNPFKVEFSGHMAIGIKKISPGGHWVGITGIASEKAKLNWEETLYIHALVSMGLHDAFISCWEEKYDSDRVRPESVIQRHLDQEWRPLLQTPPFPEYTSGHSVISSATAEILTAYFGDNFNFIDTSEIYFGLPERAFDSFYQAAEEAAISRLYGGIHFRDAIEEGVKQGRKIGLTILEIVNPPNSLANQWK
ncbi:vanadium-dependent haloperoxidase [Mongoliitalea daihaiensis]|uniref:vanadium-dependent haloperoxidase n=1 Tax=Mongoliitalea daihaiensis TaxID=2782006 RepID=UPI001F3FEF2E|nr:vanadium-dependent haloperoxidase [Mongoliitalea daihaiensis]UJP63257.1 vanadium-dependent haloperoxidase [Mongoliitalea daihaiensis]